MPAVCPQVIPGEKADAAGDDEQHHGHVDRRLDGVGGEGGERLPDAHQVKAGVAEGGHGVEQGHPQPLDPEVPAEHWGHGGGPQQFQQQGGLDGKAGQPHDAAQGRGREGLLHGISLHEGNFLAGEDGEGGRHGDDPHAADLDEEQEDPLPESGPMGRGVVDHQPCDAYCRGGGEQRVPKGCGRPLPAGQGQRQQQRPQQYHAGKAQDDDLGGGQMLSLPDRVRRA